MASRRAWSVLAVLLLALGCSPEQGVRVELTPASARVSFVLGEIISAFSQSAQLVALPTEGNKEVDARQLLLRLQSEVKAKGCVKLAMPRTDDYDVSFENCAAGASQSRLAGKAKCSSKMAGSSLLFALAIQDLKIGMTRVDGALQASMDKASPSEFELAGKGLTITTRDGKQATFSLNARIWLLLNDRILYNSRGSGTLRYEGQSYDFTWQQLSLWVGELLPHRGLVKTKLEEGGETRRLELYFKPYTPESRSFSVTLDGYALGRKFQDELFEQGAR